MPVALATRFPASTRERRRWEPMKRARGRARPKISAGVHLERGPAAEAAADPKGNDRSAYQAQDSFVWPVIVGLTLIMAAAALVVTVLY